MRPIRVLRLIARMNVGGPALQVVALQRGLDPDRFESRLLVGEPGDGEADYRRLRAPDVAATRVPGLGRSIRATGDARALSAVIAEIRRFRPDVIHTHTAKAGVLGRVAARLTRVPHVVHTFHGHLLHGYFGTAGRQAVVATERVLARRTDVLVAVGARVRDDLLQAGIGRAEQYRVVPPGVEIVVPPDVGDARASLGLPLDVPVVGFVARLTAIKRPDRAIAVIEEVRRRHPDVVLAIAGEGPLLEDVRAAAAPLGDTVRFLGWVSDVERIHAACDVALLTSDNEGMPVSLIEAAVIGRPAVATDVGSTAEVVVDGRTGFVRRDVSGLVEAVSALLADDELRLRMGQSAAEWGRDQFGGARLVRDVAAIYEGLVR